MPYKASYSYMPATASADKKAVEEAAHVELR